MLLPNKILKLHEMMYSLREMHVFFHKVFEGVKLF